MKIKAYILRALTHLHPGSGDSGYGAVDKMVQIDPVGELPTIFSSSLKGAFRELFVQAFPEDLKIENKKQTRMDHPLVEFMYGTGVKATREDSQKDEPRHPGAFRFHQAYLLSIPVRSNVKPFFSATSPDIIKDLLDKAELLNINLGDGTKKALSYLASQNIKEKQPKILTKDEGVWLEDLQVSGQISHNFDQEFKPLMGENIALFNHADLKRLDLPVNARNFLENGVSENLWYEQIVPRESRFYFILQEADPNEKWKEAIKAHASEEYTSFSDIMNTKFNNQVQIGGNATVGMGLCSLSSLST